MRSVVNFDQHVEGRWGFAFQDRFLGSAPPGLHIAQGNGLYAADEIGQGRVLDQILQLAAVGRGNQPHAPLGNRTGRVGFGLGPDLIDHNDLGHVVFDRLNHDLVLQIGRGHLHAARPADPGMRDIPVAGNLV